LLKISLDRRGLASEDGRRNRLTCSTIMTEDDLGSGGARMASYWTCHWQFRLWRDDINTEFDLIDGSGSNVFRKRGVAPGDMVYVISLSEGLLYLGGRMPVKRIVSRAQAVRILGSNTLYEADEWVVDEDRTGTPLHLHRRLAPAVTKQLQWILADGSERGLCFVDRTHLDGQATRGIRRLTPESAELLDQIIAVTDTMPRDGRLITVTESMIDKVG
jgi:hypothetical protein